MLPLYTYLELMAARRDRPTAATSSVDQLQPPFDGLELLSFQFYTFKHYA